MYKAIDHSNALNEFLELSGWKGLSAKEAVVEFARFCEAYDDPEIIDGSFVIWQREDFKAAFRDCGIEPDDELVDEAVEDCFHLRGWRDMSIGYGNDHLHEIALDVLNRRCLKPD